MAYDVFLVNVSRKSTQVQLPIWLSVLSNALKLHSIEFNVVDLVPVTVENREKFFRENIQSRPAIIGFNIMAGNDHINHVEKYAQMALDINPEHIIIYGGSLPSSMPELLLNNCKCSYVLAGEGEKSFPAFIHSIRNGNFYPDNIPGLFFKKGNAIVGSKPGRMIVGARVNNMYQLTEFSMPDYDSIDLEFYINYLKETNQSFEIMGSRGCKGNCSFCHKLVQGIGVKSPDIVLDEMSEIIHKYDLNRFYFVDENFLELKSVYREFVRKKRERGIDLTYRGQCRIDAIDEDICILGKDNGLAVASMGIESVNQQTLNRINKGIKISEVEEKLDMLRKYGIGFSVNFIVGFPWDTEQDYIDMINFIKKNSLEKQGKVSYLTPSPGTRLWKECVSNGQIEDEWEFIKKLGNLFFERMINFTTLPDEVLDYYYNEIASLIQRPVTYPKSEIYIEKLSALY
ncbi:MAG: B12-binding domain-containing radical SAM protein [Nitrospirae bacterium]|nr:B12-binding domain-containing radical SAM protein [Nitrospirota bacterium]MCL5976731.1 B12-binding domain-containing radical SAM protein [Nitrospirota bacterium]